MDSKEGEEGDYKNDMRILITERGMVTVMIRLILIDSKRCELYADVMPK